MKMINKFVEKTEGLKFLDTTVTNLNYVFEILGSTQTHTHTHIHKFKIWSRGSSGSIVSDYGLGDRAIEVRSLDFLVASVSRPALRPTQPPVQWVPGVLSPGLKCGRGVTLITLPYLVPRS
jgi:hypothetical protein